MGTNITIPVENVQEILLLALDKETRDSLVAQAIESLLKRKEARYPQRGTTEIERAFEKACGEVAYEIAKEEMQRPVHKDRVATLIQKAIEEAFTKDNSTFRRVALEVIGSKLADAIRRADED